MLFERQVSLYPNKYPWVDDLRRAMWQGFWNDEKFHFESDVVDFKSNTTEQQRQIIVRTASCISQIEVQVKPFWARLGDNLPHPSIHNLGIIMAHIEVIHGYAYQKLLDVLGLSQVFEENMSVPEVRGRVEYLTKHNKIIYKDTRKQYIYSLILFTLFIENVSLFSQFYILLFMNRKDNILDDTAQQIKYTRNEECYSAETEVLTPTGWRKILEMSVGDAVYQFANNGTLEQTTVQAVTRRHFAGELLEFSRKGNRCQVTPNHDMIVRYSDDAEGVFRRIPAHQVKFHKKMIIPRRAARVGGTVNDLSLLDQLRIAIQADGFNLYWTNNKGDKIARGKNGGATHTIQLKKPRKIERLRKILSNLGLSYTESSPDVREYVKFSFHLETDIDLKTFDWVDLSDKSAVWCQAFINELAHWDGWHTSTDGLGYSSTNRRCIDIAQEAGVLAGFHTKITGRVDNRSATFSDSWRIHFTTPEAMPISHGVTRTSVPYEGEVGCVSVPSGMILTRLGDETFIAGNCLHAIAGMKIINTLRVEYPELFDEDLERTIEQEILDAAKAENALIDWILGDYDSINNEDGSRLNAAVLKNYTAKRFNESMRAIGYAEPFTVDPTLSATSDWMDKTIVIPAKVDFFNTEPTSYVTDDRPDDDDF